MQKNRKKGTVFILAAVAGAIVATAVAVQRPAGPGEVRLPGAAGREAGPERPPAPAPPPEEAGQAGEGSRPVRGRAPDMTVLLVGLDRRGDENGRSDTIMLGRICPARREVEVYSIPRDTRVWVPGVGRTKINHAASYGGVPLLKATLEQWLGIRVDHWVVVDFEGFRRLVDRLGGVPVDVEKAMDYDDPSDGTHIHLPPGRQWLDGRAALDYARFRHDAEADNGRMRRQLQLLRALVLRGGDVTAWPVLLREMGELGKHVGTDFDGRALVRTAAALYPFDRIAFRARVLKGSPYVDRRDGIWYFEPDPAAVAQLRRALGAPAGAGGPGRAETEGPRGGRPAGRGEHVGARGSSGCLV
ncbi:MAG: LCP family protein [Alicyclobacillaceae bacterium]|nr:LCP family protein [Alicyclobacillaceae bacterium]